MAGSTIMVRGETSDCSSPKLDVFFTIGGVATDVAVLEFQIFDIADELLPIQVFPLSGREPVNVVDPCPVGGRLGSGHYVATYTVDNLEVLGPHEVRWFYRLLVSSPEEVFAEQFEVLLVSASTSTDPATIASFKKRFPDLAGFSNELIQCVLDEAECEVDPNCFRDKTETAKLYLAAHLLMSTSGARAKGASSVSAGSASISFDTSKTSLDSTYYGQRYRMLARQCAGAMVIC